MVDSSTSVLDRDTDAPAVPAHAEKAGDLTELLATGVPAQPAPNKVQEIPAIAAEEAERVAEEWRVFFVSLSLLALFVVIFVGYLVLDAAHLLPLSLHSDQ